MVRTRGTTDRGNAPRPGMPRGRPHETCRGAAPAPNPEIEPELVEENQDAPIYIQPEGPPPPAQPPAALVMTPALQAAIVQLLMAIGVVPQAPTLVAGIPALQDPPVQLAPEVQLPPPVVAPLSAVPEGMISLQDQNMLGVFQRLSPPIFSVATSEVASEFLTTCQE
ncbi:uncharacterized protein LOC129892808 [Solanum dulcamara]|uniref:uncharacterized protein LOC129892808 n=1 Tax=Solanum dulcamara TaxID=45834 RepID=UPI0024867706|nr:uncharacterized protein LOC129892808 [Solanum dulcamara]